MVSVSREGLIAERDDLLRRLGTSLEEFTSRAEAYALVGDEWEVWSRLQDIDFLLGDDDHTRLRRANVRRASEGFRRQHRFDRPRYL